MGTCQSEDQIQKLARRFNFSQLSNEGLSKQTDGEATILNEELEKAIKILQQRDLSLCKIIKFGEDDVIAVAEHRSNNTKYTIKIQFLRLRERGTSQRTSPESTISLEQYKRQTKLETSALMKCQHQNIIKVFDSFVSDYISFVMMEECKFSLDQYIQQRKKLEEYEIIQILSQLVSGMEYLHQQNLLVGDLNHQNILIDNFGNIKYSCLIFNKSSYINGKYYLCKNSFYSQLTPIFLPPYIKKIASQVYKSKDDIDVQDYQIIYDQSCDVWALGILIYLLMGQSLEFIINYGLNQENSQFQCIESLSQNLNTLIQEILDCNSKSRPTIFDIRIWLNKYLIKGGGQKKERDSDDIENYMSNQDSGISQPKIFPRSNTLDPEPRLSIDSRSDKFLLQLEGFSTQPKQEFNLKAIEDDPFDKISCIHLGILYQKELKQFESAESYFRKALEIDSEYVPAILNLANLYISESSRLDDAEEKLIAALKLDSMNINIYLGLGKIYTIKKQWQLAYNNYKIAHQLDPTNYESIYSIASILEECKNFKEALAHYQAAIEQDPYQILSFIRIAELQLIYFDQEQEAHDNLKKALLLDKTNNIVWLYLSILSREITEFEEMSEYLNPNEAITHENAKYYLKSGILFHKYQHNYHSAKQCFEQCIELDDSSSQTYNRAVWYLADTLQNINTEKLKQQSQKGISISTSTDLDD